MKKRDGPLTPERNIGKRSESEYLRQQAEIIQKIKLPGTRLKFDPENSLHFFLNLRFI
jgi:hypothetical protein